MRDTSVNKSPSLCSSPQCEMTHKQKASLASLLPMGELGVGVVEIEAARPTFTFHDLKKQEKQTLVSSHNSSV